MIVQAIFLVSVIAGALMLVGAVGVARMHWRADCLPYRETYAFALLRRPASFVDAAWVRRVRALSLAGSCLLAIAIGCLVYQLLVDFSAPPGG